MTAALLEPPTPTGAPTPTAPIPALADFAVVAAALPTSRGGRALHRLLSTIDPEADLVEREQMVVRLGRWLRRGGSVPVTGGAKEDDLPTVARLWALCSLIEAFPGVRQRVSRLLQSFLRHETSRGFLARIGIPGDRGLFAETVDRVSRGVMPQPLDEKDISHLLALLFRDRRDANWLGQVPPALVAALIVALRTPFAVISGTPSSVPPPDDVVEPEGRAIGRLSGTPAGSSRYSIWSPLRAGLLDAILLLASRVSAAGLSDALRARSPSGSLRESPFFHLPRRIDALLAASRDDRDGVDQLVTECRGLIGECRRAGEVVLQRLEETGVSVDVVYRLELIERSLVRIELLLDVLVPQSTEDLARRVKTLLVVLLRERERDRSLVDIVRTTTRLLARKVIERAGHTGEHYITVTRREYLKMFLSAAGGGVLTAVTTAVKFFIGWLHRPPLQYGLLAGTNYAVSFLAMQLFSFTLATKQPSMTAAAIAGAMKSSAEVEELVTTMARLVRSQLVAAAGNVLMVIPASFAVDYWWLSRTGNHLLDAEYATEVITTLHPTQSGTLPFAAFTGIILWLSSLCGGWLENWAVYRRLPEAIAEHRIRRIVGRRACEWASRVFARNIGGIGGNVSVGFMMGLTPVIGQFAGLPLDIRHVTLSTGSVTMAVCSLGPDSFAVGLTAAILGIAGILALNLTVSFVLAIAVAMRARDVSLFHGASLFGAVVVGFFRSPGRVFFTGPNEKPSAH